MKKISDSVKKETGFVALWSIVFSVLMQAAFLISGHWDMTVLWGNLLGAGVGILNFFSLGLTLQNAVEKEEKQARVYVRISHSLRTVLTVAFLAIGCIFPNVFNIIALFVPLVFSRFAILIRYIPARKKESGNGE